MKCIFFNVLLSPLLHSLLLLCMFFLLITSDMFGQFVVQNSPPVNITVRKMTKFMGKGFASAGLWPRDLLSDS